MNIQRGSMAGREGQEEQKEADKPPALPADEQTDTADERLMDLVLQGDRIAFKTLMRRHMHRITALSRRILHQKGDAEDAAQEVFVNIWRKRESWAEWRSSFATWIYRITVHKCIDFNRMRQYDPLGDQDSIVATTPDVIASLHAEEFSTILRSALAQLSTSQQHAMALFYHEGLSAPQCAEILDMNVQAVEGLLKRGRKRLREIMLQEKALEDSVELPAGYSLMETADI